MAKTNGPLISSTASGAIGQRLVFSQRRSGQQARFQKAQKDVITSDRTIHRSNYSAAVAAWNDLDLITKESFNSLAAGEAFTGYNLFVKLYLTGVIIGSDIAIYGFRNYGIFIYGKI